MGISQLLNDIATGASVPAKRKTEEDLQGNEGKKSRTTAGDGGGTQAATPSPSAISAFSKRDAGVRSSTSSSLSVGRPPPRALQRQAPASTLPRQVRGPVIGERRVPGVATTGKPAPETASAKKPSSDEAQKDPPKKGSYREILERGRKAQAAMGNFGKIQHKPVERGPRKHERQELKAERAQGPRKAPNGSGSKHVPTPGRTQSRAVDHDGLVPRKVVNGKATNGKVSGEKKPRKAALATTGYQGTARPPPGATAVALGRSAGATGSRDRVGHGSLPFARPRRRRYEEEDGDMDDFIEYDDDEPFEGEPTRYGHGADEDEEDESDMEADLSDIDKEEARASYIARKEDEEEAALEMEHRRKKEARKHALQNGSGRAGGR